MALYVMSDTHFSLGVDKPMDVFGARWDGYEEKIKTNWEKLITDEDTVIITGDVSWGMKLEESLEDMRFLDALPGKKLLGKGNHDYWWETVKKMKTFFSQNGITTLDFLYNNSYKTDGIVIAGSRGWFYDKRGNPPDADYSLIVAREVIRTGLSVKDALDRYGEIPYVFLHFPPVFRGCICREILDTLHEYGIKKCYYGHIHNCYDIPPSFEYEGIEFIITSADYLSFTPLRVI